MRKSVLLVTIIAIIVIMSIPCFGVDEFTLDYVTGMHSGDSVTAGMAIEFGIRFTIGDHYISGSTNGFRIWTHRNGEYTDNDDPVTAWHTGEITGDMYDGGIFSGCYRINR